MCAKRIRKGAKVTQINLIEAKEKIIKIKTLEGMAQSTLNQYNLVFNDLIGFFEKDTRVNDITLNDARDFINSLLHEKSDTSSRFKQVAKKGVKPSSVNNYLQNTRAAFNILKREEVLKGNVFNEIRNVKFQKHKVETLTVDEIKRIFNANINTHEDNVIPNVPAEFQNLAKCYHSPKQVLELWKCVKISTRYLAYMNHLEKINLGIRAFKQCIVNIKLGYKVRNIFGYFFSILNAFLDTEYTDIVRNA